MNREQDGMRPEPFFAQPKVEKLVQRGPRRYFLVGKTADGRPVEIRLSAVKFESGRS